MLRIHRTANGRVVFSLSGRIETEDLAELQRLLSLESPRQEIVLDLQDVTIVDRDAMKFLASCESDGVELDNCPAYVREWIAADRNRRS
jgi:anti-anti-sigma regulatory factor